MKKISGEGEKKDRFYKYSWDRTRGGLEREGREFVGEGIIDANISIAGYTL